MRISVFGLGYVGAVSAACFAKSGHRVIGVDINPAKVDVINSGRSPIVEEGIDELVNEVVARGNLSATCDVAHAVANTDVSLICVGTPSNDNGSLKLDYVERVSQQIGEALAGKKDKHLIIVRSTMLPGSVNNVVRPALERMSGKTAGEHFDICINPEFLREGTSIKDFYSPPFTLIGADNESASRTATELYAEVPAPIYVTSVEAAEMVKYACNCFHGVKVVFANEIGNICKELGIDSHEVMEVFCKDTKLNLSPYYLKPGFAFGGSCLPKDLRALKHKARELDLDVPLLDATLESNLLQIERVVQMILRTRKKRVGVLGFAFKAGTDDVRESPVVSVIERLIGKGLDVMLYDREVSIAKLTGANKEFIEREIPHISRLMAPNVQSVLDHSELVLIGTRSEEFLSVDENGFSDRTVIDLVRLFVERRSDGNYQGLCW